MSNGHGHLPELLFSLSLIYFLSQLLTIIFNKFKLPSVVAQLSAGLLLAFVFVFLPEGNFLHSQIDFMKHSEIITLIGELGVIILLLEVGLETEISQILSTGRDATLVALGGVIAPFLCAFGLHYGFVLANNYFGAELPVFSLEEILFIGLVFAATSIGVTAQVFQELKILASYNARIILAAAVIDDVLGLILLSVIVGLVNSGQFELSAAALIIAKAVIFLGLAIWLNPRLTAKAFPILGKLGRNEPIAFLIWILCLCFAFAFIAQFLGLAGIIGAFALGATLDSISIKNAFDDGKKQKVDDYIIPIRAFLVPVFFVKVGLSIDPLALFTWMSLLLTVLACISKLMSSYLLLPFKVQMDRLLVGIGMMPRGEVGLVVAQIGYSSKILQPELYSALLAAIIATTVLAPILLQKLLAKQQAN